MHACLLASVCVRVCARGCACGCVCVCVCVRVHVSVREERTYEPSKGLPTSVKRAGGGIQRGRGEYNVSHKKCPRETGGQQEGGCGQGHEWGQQE